MTNSWKGMKYCLNVWRFVELDESINYNGEPIVLGVFVVVLAYLKFSIWLCLINMKDILNIPKKWKEHIFLMKLFLLIPRRAKSFQGTIRSVGRFCMVSIFTVSFSYFFFEVQECTSTKIETSIPFKISNCSC
jgi:type IV secretory pathway TrbL component